MLSLPLASATGQHLWSVTGAASATGAPAPPARAVSATQSSAPAAAAQVPSSAPRTVPDRVLAPAIGLDAEVEPYTDEMVRARDGVDPDTTDRVAWWTGAGSPSTRADNTVYLYGHTWHRPAVFNEIGRLASGDVIIVQTDAGDVRYRVTGRFVVDKDDLAGDTRVRAAVPGRLLLIGCYRETGNERYTTENLVVQAELAADAR